MLLKHIKTIKTYLLNLLFPLKCLGCRVEGAWLCRNCFSQIKQTEQQYCPVCKRTARDFGAVCRFCKNKTSLDGVFVAADDKSGRLKKLIHQFKYNFITEVENDLTRILLSSFLKEYLTSEDLVLVPIPLHKKRMRYRGFNQAEILASSVSFSTNIPCESGMITRQKHTTPQMKLKRAERLDNLRNAFEVIQKIPPDKEILLVDDVITTGSTLEECARILKAHGAKRVWGLVLSRGT